MKKSIICLLVLLWAISGQTQNLIAVTNETSSSFYETLDLAITNAKDGDVLYLPGRSFSISVPINKQLQIIGVGHHPDSCRATGITQITGDIKIVSGSDRGSLIGCKITGGITFVTNTGQNINYYSIERCNLVAVTLTSQTSNILIKECIVHKYINGNGVEGLQISKCIIEAACSYLKSNCQLINNVFMLATSEYIYFNYLTSCIFRNNIFLNRVVDSSIYYPCTQLLFSNNLFLDGQSLNSTSNSFSNSIIGPVTDLFVKKTKDVFDYDQDYHILSTSPAHNTSTDGTDLGIYGTASPWKEGSLPSNPHIQSKIISTTGGNLNVKIKVAAQDY